MTIDEIIKSIKMSNRDFNSVEAKLKSLLDNEEISDYIVITDDIHRGGLECYFSLASNPGYFFKAYVVLD